MKNKIYISKYCSIEDKKIIVNDKIDFEDNESISYKEFIKKTYQNYQISYPKFFKMDNLCKLGFLSAEILLQKTDYKNNERNDNLGLIITNAASSIDADLKHQESISDRNNYFPSPSVFVYTLPNIMIGEISIKNKIYGESTFFISEKPDFDFLYYYINDLINDKIVESVICGWVDYEANRYKSVLFLVEKTNNPLKNIIFDSENMSRIFYKK